MALVSTTIPFSLKGLEVFLAVCEGGGITQAARQLRLTQPSVSQRIAELETSLGVVLFDRDTRPLTLTSAGAVLQQHAAALIAEASGILPTLRQVGRIKVPSLRIGLVDSISRALCPSLFSYLEEHADRSSIYSGLTRSHLAELLLRRLDIFLGTSQADQVDRLERWPLIEEPYVLVCPADVAPPRSTADLVGLSERLPLLRHSARSSSGMEIEQHLRRLKVDIPERMEFDTSDTMAHALVSGRGWAVTSPLCAYQGQLRSGDLVFHPFPHTIPTRRLTLIARARELGRVPQEIAARSRAVLAEVLQPYVAEHMPWVRLGLNPA